MISLTLGSEPWWKGKSLGHRGSRARVLIIQQKSVLCPVNHTEIEHRVTFHKLSHIEGPKLKRTLLSIYKLLSALWVLINNIWFFFKIWLRTMMLQMIWLSCGVSCMFETFSFWNCIRNQQCLFEYHIVSETVWLFKHNGKIVSLSQRSDLCWAGNVLRRFYCQLTVAIKWPLVIGLAVWTERDV